MDGLAEAVARYPWHHSIDLGGGVVTPGSKSLDLNRREASAFFDSVRIDGASVLDIGAWNGGYSFEAKRRGASRVVASDSFCWDHPVYRGRDTFDLARSALGLDVEALHVDAMDLDPHEHGIFDVVLFAGVLYHLKDPVRGLEIAASLARDVLIVETQIDLHHLDRPAAAFYPGRELSGDDSNWWGPNIPCVLAMLRGAGFADVDVSQVSGNRGIFHAWRSPTRRIGSPPFGLVDHPRREKLKAARRLILEAIGMR